MKINRMPEIALATVLAMPEIALATVLAMGCPSDDSSPQFFYPDTTIQYPHGNGVVIKGVGNETTTEKRAAAHLEQEYGEGYVCHDLSSHPIIGKILPKHIDESRSKIDALTRCAPAAEKDPECTVEVPFDKDGNPITSLWC